MYFFAQNSQIWFVFSSIAASRYPRDTDCFRPIGLGYWETFRWRSCQEIWIWRRLLFRKPFLVAKGQTKDMVNVWRTLFFFGGEGRQTDLSLTYSCLSNQLFLPKINIGYCNWQEWYEFKWEFSLNLTPISTRGYAFSHTLQIMEFSKIGFSTFLEVISKINLASK